MADEQRSPNDPVWIKHPDVETIGGPVPFHTFTSLWRGKGWVEVSPALVEASRLLEKDVTDLHRLTRDELDAVARNAGLDPEGAKTKVDLVALIEGTEPEAVPAGAGG